LRFSQVCENKFQNYLVRNKKVSYLCHPAAHDAKGVEKREQEISIKIFERLEATAL